MSSAIAAELALFAAAAFSAAVLALALWGWRDRRHAARDVPPDGDAAFLFEGETLVDATGSADRLMAAAPRFDTTQSDLRRLIGLIRPLFRDLSASLDDLSDGEAIDLTSSDGGTALMARRRGDHLTLTLRGDADGETPATIDRNGLAALERELETLRATTDHLPSPVWRQDKTGAITWINGAYADALRRTHGPGALDRWPLPPLFETGDLQMARYRTPRRLRLTAPGGPDAWYDLCAVPLEDGALITATDATEAVAAGTQLRAFTQTLTKTFAHLAIGLAVFDRHRHLTIFNPALTDLTGLPVEFLAGRPRLTAVLDRLRERRMIPEPKNYQSWRARIAALEAAASDGTYAETWSLPSGQTFRVTGRPHPDGALALFIEDLSAEMTLTRRFRAELQMGQAVLDTLDEAIAVFASSGILAMSNAAYARLWGVDPATGLADLSVAEASRTWLARTAPSPVWGDLREFIRDTRDRASWTADLRLKDGRRLDCRVVPMAGGATLVGFTPTAAPTKVVAPLREPA